jgi:hypothetical protein
MIAITISTNYDDILNIVIPMNYKYFYKWFIVTDKNDKKTIDVINKYNLKNIEIVYFDFYKDGKKFNKGGAVKYVQEMISNYNYNGLVLIIDSDIVLPKNFPLYFTTIKPDKNTIYGCKRLDFYSLENLKNNKPDFIYNMYNSFFVGYFQLYLYNKDFLYEDSYNCSECDAKFLKYFKNTHLIPNLCVGHLGKNEQNWNGRINKDDFKI